jgi:hypothetical protein
MPQTTVSKVRSIASHLSKLSDQSIELYIEDAVLELEDWEYDDKYQEKMERYMAAHFATLDHPKAVSEAVKGLGSKDYANKTGTEGLEITEYGKELLRIMKKSQGPTFMVFS